MQYHIQTLVKHLFDKESFEQVTVQELKQFTDDYPYAAVGQFLYAKKLKDAGSYNHNEQSEQASLYFHNALWLRWSLNRKEEAPALPAPNEETAQQPGFRIVVQMPKNVTATQPVTQEEEKKEPVAEIVETDTAKITDVVEEQPILPGEAENSAPVEAAPVAAHETGTREETMAPTVTETIATEQAQPEEAPADETVTEAEAAPAVAFAENSRLAEENVAEVAVNAVSITEEVLTTPINGDITTDVAETSESPVVEETTTSAAAENTVAAEQPTPVEEPVAVTTSPVEETGKVDEIVAEQPAPVEATTEVAQAELATAQEPAAVEAPATEAAQSVSAAEAVINIAEAPPVALEQNGPPEPVAAEAQPVIFTPASQEAKTQVDLGEPIFESFHTIDYFASQGIKLQQDDFKDKLGKQLKSFTDWLRSMKRIGPIETNTSLDEVTNQSIQRIADHSVEEKEVLTEAMAEVWAKQGHTAKAIRVYEKLSLLNPAKSPYFVSRIEQLKAL